MNFVSKIIEKLVDIKFFKLIFLISCIFYCIPFTNDFFSKAFKIFIFWGIILFLYNFFFNKKYTLKKQDYLLFGFLAIALIGCFINYKSNLILNIISVVYLFIQIILMLSYNKYKNIDEKIKEYKIFSYILIVFTFICSVFSILIFLLNVKYSYTDGFQQIIYGVFEGRLWGFYSNPNTLGQISIISIWTSILLLIINKNYNKKTNKFLNGFICLNILCEFICLILSNSRSAVIGFSLSIAIFSLFMIAYNNMRKDQNIFVSIFKNKINTFVKMLAIGIFIGLSAFILKNSMAFFADEFKDVSIINNVDNIDNDHEDDSEEKDKESGKVKVDREFATSDVSNGRFEIWNAGIKVFRLYPIFGVGSKNVNEISNKYDVDPKLIEALVKQESGFNPNAKSKAGALGLMQLMPSTAKGLGVSDPMDVRQNVEGGVKYVRSMLDRFNGNIILALAAYNAGPNAVSKYDGVPPYKETQNYVRNILSNYL